MEISIEFKHEVRKFSKYIPSTNWSKQIFTWLGRSVTILKIRLEKNGTDFRQKFQKCVIFFPLLSGTRRMLNTAKNETTAKKKKTRRLGTKIAMTWTREAGETKKKSEQEI